MAKLQTLGIAGLSVSGPTPAPAPARPSSAGPDLAEYGASGTPLFGGFVRELGEYNPEMTGLDAIATYERMRRSDGQVAATLMAMKLPIRSAQWDVVIDDDASPVEREARDFVHQCFFQELDFPAVLRNALLMLDFGVAAHEDVYEVVGNRVHLKKLASRLPLTFYRWLTDESGEELSALEQLGYRGGNYVCVQVPANKIAVFTYEQEGQNYTGRSVMRPMYQHWYIKTNLYKVDAIACERNGMGVPTIIMAQGATKEDIATAKKFVEQLTVHERTGIVLPNGYTFKLEGVTGTLRDPKELIGHQNMMISMSGLAMFMMLGQSAGGNRALGDTMADFFYLGLDATAVQVERVLNLTTVKRLVDFNFPGVQKYPRIKCQQILTVKFEGIVAALKDLATAGVIEPDEKLESYIREKMGAPAVDKATARPKATVQIGGQVPGAGGQGGAAATGTSGGAQAGAEGGPERKTEDGGAAAPGAKQQPGNAKSGDSNGEGQQEKIAAADVGSVHVSGAMGSETRSAEAGAAGSEAGRPDFSGVKLRRDPRGAEKFLAAAEIVGELDRGRDEIAAALRRARSRVQAEIVQKLMSAPVARLHRVSIELDQKLVDEVEAILRRVSDFGAQQVADERERQLAGKAPSDAARLRAADRQSRRRDPLGLYADATVAEFQNDLQQRAANSTLDYRRRQGDLTNGEVIRAIEADLDEQSDKWIDGVASKGANEAFADGRADGYEEHADEISSVIYSALLDINTCEACAQADGQEGATPDDIPDVPNPDCDGGDKCRCVHVYVFADEGSKAA